MAEYGESVAERRRVFSPETRLRRRADFQFIRRHGEAAVGKYCVIRRVDPPDGNRRVAFVISRHYCRKAVVRNRARRLFREVYRRILPDLPDSWLEFRPRARMQGVTATDLEHEVRRLIGKLGGFKAPSGETGDGRHG